MSFFNSIQNLMNGATNTLNILNLPETARKLLSGTNESGQMEPTVARNSVSNIREYDRAPPSSPINSQQGHARGRRQSKTYLSVYTPGGSPSLVPPVSPTMTSKRISPTPSPSKTPSSLPSANAKTKRVQSLRTKPVSPKIPVLHQIRSNTIPCNHDMERSESFSKLHRTWGWRKRKDSSSRDCDHHFSSGRSSTEDIFEMRKSSIDEASLYSHFSNLNAFRTVDERSEWLEAEDTGTKIKDVDDGFFELYGGLFAHHNEKKQAYFIQLHNSVISDEPPLESSVGIQPKTRNITVEEFKSVYKEVLYTIRNKIGTDLEEDSECLIKDDLYRFAQKAFHIDSALHAHLMSLVFQEESPIVVLNVIVIEAESLEAKDPDGFSDPYCMLGICPGNSSHLLFNKSSPPNKPIFKGSTPQPRRASLDPYSSTFDNFRESKGLLDKSKKHSSFKISFIRRRSPSKSPTITDSSESGLGFFGGEDIKNDAAFAIPAKFVKTTTVKPNTLFPSWNERFRFDIEESETDVLHLDIWDHDDESSVFDAVKKLNEVKGIRGLGRYFKQVAQSARTGGQDDFLGSVNVVIKEIPSRGVEKWYKLEARSAKSHITGSIKLKVWLSTRENRGLSEEEDRWNEIQQHELIYGIFVDYQLKLLSSHEESSAREWDGNLPEPAMEILHQHEIQGDLSEFQVEAVKWKVLHEKVKTKYIKFGILFDCLRSLEEKWNKHVPLMTKEEKSLSESFGEFIEYCIALIRHHRQLFPPWNKTALHKFEYVLRSVIQLTTMSLFNKCCSGFEQDIKLKIINEIERSTADLFCNNFDLTGIEGLISSGNAREALQDILDLLIITTTDLEIGLQHYHPQFKSLTNVGYFSVVYEQYDKLICESLCPLIQRTTAQSYVDKHVFGCRQQDSYITFFLSEVCLAMGDFYRLKENLSASEQRQLSLPSHYREWFIPVYKNWIKEASKKLAFRFEKIMEYDKVIRSSFRTHNDATDMLRSTSSQDLTSVFFYIKEFWRQLGLAEAHNPKPLLIPLIQAIMLTVEKYVDISSDKLAETGFFGCYSSSSDLTDPVCIAINNLEHVFRHVTRIPEELGFSKGPTESLSSSESASLLTNEKDDEEDQLQRLVFDATKKIDTTLYSVLEVLISKHREALKKHIFHLAWSPDTLPTIEAIAPLLEFLDKNLSILVRNFLTGNYYRYIDVLWESVLSELKEQAGTSTGEKMPIFFSRLDDALEILYRFFTLGLPAEKLYTSNFQKVHLLLSLNKMSTESLIDGYHTERVKQCLRTEHSDFGTLTVRVYFYHDCLCIDVLRAKDVIPLDSNGLSDPYVIIELLPKRLHKACVEQQQTQVQKSTLHPVFDESFKFSTSLEACQDPAAVVCFTLMDHDVLSFDDFGGEAYLGLSTVPGVSCENTSIDNFHGLKLIHLPLLFQNVKGSHMQYTTINYAEQSEFVFNIWDFGFEKYYRIAF